MVKKRCSSCGRRVSEKRCPSCGSIRYSWAYVVDIGAVGGKRKQHTKSGFKTKAEAVAALVVRRGFDLVEGGSSAADFCDDLFGGLVPDEGLGVVVPVFGPDLDGIDEVGHAGEHASA